jgi:ABC-type transport system substrate-binding protein
MTSRKTKILISVVAVVILVAAAFSVIEFYHPAPTSHVFTDTAATTTIDELDPATGFGIDNEPLFTALYQELVEFNGSSNQVVPVLAQSITNVSNQNYTFHMRPYATFSNNDPVNASDVWFSMYRGIIMGQGPYISDYPNILFNESDYSTTLIALPWGLEHALRYAGYTIDGNNMTDNATIAANDLDYVLSNFNYNSSNVKLMSYPNQAVVVNSQYSVNVNAMHEYVYMLSDLAGWWGSVIYPGQVDAHGGVVYNTQSTYLNTHGAIGSGPYMIKTLGSGLTSIVIVNTTNYWATGHPSVPAVAQPAHIPEIVIDYGLSHTDRLEDFDKNLSMISYVAPSSFKDIINGYYNSSQADSSLARSYSSPSNWWLSMNTGRNYTKNVYFRRALVDANNYTGQLALYANNYNGTPEAYNELGPLSPAYGSAFYNPTGLSPQSQNLTRAIQNMTEAGNMDGFYVTLPDGHSIGNTSGIDLSDHTFHITSFAPPTSLETAEISLFISSFALIGLHFASSYITPTSASNWVSPNTTPRFVMAEWEPDYPDPIAQQLIAVYDVIDGGTYGGNFAWVDNSTLQNYFANMDFENITVQGQDMKSIYNITYNLSAYIWMPVPLTYFFVQPYVHGFEANGFDGYFYNMMYISYGDNSGTSSSYDPGFTVSLVADVTTFIKGF